MTSIIPLLIVGVGLCFIIGFAGLVLVAVAGWLWSTAKRLLGLTQDGRRRA